MNAALLVGVGFVLPTALQANAALTRLWWVSVVLVALSLWLDAGIPAAGCAAPWLGLSLLHGLRALRGRTFWPAMVAGFTGTAALALITSRLELELFGITEPIVKLTALHFTYAGAGTLALAAAHHERQRARFFRLTRWLALVAPPVVALGFVTKWSVAQVGGALLMTLAVWGVAAAQLGVLRQLSPPGRVLLVVSSLSPLVAMVLGVSWAANQCWPSVPALTVPDMVPTHGALNAFGFVLCGQVALRLAPPPSGRT